MKTRLFGDDQWDYFDDGSMVGIVSRLAQEWHWSDKHQQVGYRYRRGEWYVDDKATELYKKFVLEPQIAEMIVT